MRVNARHAPYGALTRAVRTHLNTCASFVQDGTLEVEEGNNVTDGVGSKSDDDDVAGIVLLEVMSALDFTMIAVALLTAFNTRSVTSKLHYRPLPFLVYLLRNKLYTAS